MQPEPQQSAWLYEALAWLELNRKRVITGIVLVLAVIVAGYIFFWSRHQAEINANDALLALKPSTSASEDQKAAAAADFLRVAEAHSSSSVADRALLLAAGDLYREGRYAEAQTQFQKALDQDRSSALAPVAALGVAASLDAQNKVDEALAAYQAVVARYGEAPASARAKFAMALIHEGRNEPREALRIYDELTTSRKMGRASMEASIKRENLLKLHPELAPTNTTSVVLPPISVTAGTNVPAATNAPGAPTNKIAGQP